MIICESECRQVNLSHSFASVGGQWLTLTRWPMKTVSCSVCKRTYFLRLVACFRNSCCVSSCLLDRLDPLYHSDSHWILICAWSGNPYWLPLWFLGPLPQNFVIMISAFLACALDIKRPRGHLLGVGHYRPLRSATSSLMSIYCRSPFDPPTLLIAFVCLSPFDLKNPPRVYRVIAFYESVSRNTNESPLIC